MNLHLDFETRSSVDIRTCGLDVYARNAEILMLAWAVNDEAPHIWLPHIGPMPSELRKMLTSTLCKKVAWNAAFERAIFKYCLGIDIPIDQWLDPSVLARYASVSTGKLAMASEVWKLGSDGKLTEHGERLMRVFSMKGKRGHRTPDQEPAKFLEFQAYCRQDVTSERQLLHLMKGPFGLPMRERRLLQLDQEINERGIPVDLTFVANAKKIVTTEGHRLRHELDVITSLENPNSVSQLLPWLKQRGYTRNSLLAKYIPEQLPLVTPAARKALELRSQLSKASTKKLDAISNRVSPDGWLRRNYKFYGAHTGRWSGEGVQLQNLPRGVLNESDYLAAVEAIRMGRDVSRFGNPLDVVSSCLRGAFRAPRGQHFSVCDLSAIEVRVLAWLTRCRDLLRVFETGLDPYKDFATRFYTVDYNNVTKAQRQICKPAVLGCGYQLSGGTVAVDHKEDEIKTGLWGYAAQMGVNMSQAEAERAVSAYRAAYPEVPLFWRNVQNAAINAVLEKKAYEVNGITFTASKARLIAYLPSGRVLNYLRPIVEDDNGRPRLTYEAVSLAKKWRRRATYGGHLTENLVQAIARDVLAEGMLRASDAGFKIVGHAHDEIITLTDVTGSHNYLASLMTRPMEWAPEIPLAAEGYESEVYRK